MEEPNDEEIENVVPSFDRSEVESKRGLLNTIMRFERIKAQHMLPAIVSNVNDDHTVDLYIIVKKRIPTIDGPKYQTRNKLTHIPWMQMRHGGYTIEFPIQEGDTGWIIAADRANGYARQKNAKQDVSENKGPCDLEGGGVGLFEYGMFIPDSWFSEEKWKDNKTLTIRGLKKDCSIDLIIDDPSNTSKYLKKFSVRKDGLYLDDEPFTGGLNLISGDYSNVVFTDAGNGKTKIDVFYK